MIRRCRDNLDECPGRRPRSVMDEDIDMIARSAQEHDPIGPQEFNAGMPGAARLGLDWLKIAVKVRVEPGVTKVSIGAEPKCRGCTVTNHQPAITICRPGGLVERDVGNRRVTLWRRARRVLASGPYGHVP